MTAAETAVEVSVADIESPPEPWVPELLQGRVRAAQTRADWTLLLHPRQKLTTGLHAHMARLDTESSIGANVPLAAYSMRIQDVRWALDSIRDERAGTLARFVGYLEENGVVKGKPKSFEERHAVQKCAYLASEFGGPLHYEFDFLENGAYSSTLALDLYAKARESAGVAPFKNNPGEGSVFVQMVQGRGMRTLQAMTFALRDMRLGVKRDEFVDTMLRERRLYSRRVLEWAFDRVFEAREILGRG